MIRGVLVLALAASASAFQVESYLRSLPQSAPSRVVLTRPSATSTILQSPSASVSYTPKLSGSTNAPSRVDIVLKQLQPTPASSVTDMGKVDWGNVYRKFSFYLTNLFPVWTVLVSLVALKSPSTFTWLTTEYFTAGLATLMLSMGITLSPADFVRVATRPNAVLLNFAMCYAMMPALGFGLGKAFALDPAMTAGLVLVGSINGGQASNLCTYIAKGDVALSVLMTTVTTLGAIVMTPLICKVLLGAIVPVDAVGVGAALSAIMCKLPRSCHAPLESPALFSPIPPVSFVAPLHYRLLIC